MARNITPARTRHPWAWLTAAVAGLCLLCVALFYRGRMRAGREDTPLDPYEVSEGDVPPEPTPHLTSAADDQDLVIYRHPNDRMEIALTFDDGPHPRYTPMILEILEEYGIKATFFMIGENVRYYTPAAEAVIRAGHEVGNHTDSHRCLKSLGTEDMKKEIRACEESIASVSECRPRFVRPPEGEMSETMKNLVSDMDYRIVLWDVDTRDWAHTPPATIAAQVLEDVHPGDIILMHDFIGERSPTPEALRLLIPALLERGYRFVTVSELVDDAE